MKYRYALLTFIIAFISSCALITDEYQANQRKVIAYLLEDLPIPKDADIIKVPSVLLGTGDSISGRIVLKSSLSPAENLIFYGNQTPTTGWQLLSSKVGAEITLVYAKNNRIATIDMKPSAGIASFFSGDSSSDIVISVVHPDSIADQNPYDDLNYNNLPELP
jgi:hypothetical protein